jgi:hypothetical protein
MTQVNTVSEVAEARAYWIGFSLLRAGFAHGY